MRRLAREECHILSSCATNFNRPQLLFHNQFDLGIFEDLVKYFLKFSSRLMLATYVIDVLSLFQCADCCLDFRHFWNASVAAPSTKLLPCHGCRVHAILGSHFSRVIPCLSVGPLMPNFSRHVLFNTKMYQLLKNLSKLNSSQFNNASVRCVFSNLSKGYAQWLFGDVLNERWSTERAALIKRLARAWEQEA